MVKIKIKTKYLWGIVMILIPLIGAYFNIFALFLFFPLGLFLKSLNNDFSNQPPYTFIENLC